MTKGHHRQSGHEDPKSYTKSSKLKKPGRLSAAIDEEYGAANADFQAVDHDGHTPKSAASKAERDRVSGTKSKKAVGMRLAVLLVLLYLTYRLYRSERSMLLRNKLTLRIKKKFGPSLPLAHSTSPLDMPPAVDGMLLNEPIMIINPGEFKPEVHEARDVSEGSFLFRPLNELREKSAARGVDKSFVVTFNEVPDTEDKNIHFFETRLAHPRVYYSVGKVGEHHGVLHDILIQKAQNQMATYAGGVVCRGASSPKYLTTDCIKTIDKLAALDANLVGPVQTIADGTFEEMKKTASPQVVKGNTIMMIMDRSCNNIAHYAGRALYLFHLLKNPASYRVTGPIDHIIIILGSPEVMTKFPDDAQRREPNWHEALLEILVYPDVPVKNNIPYLYQEMPSWDPKKPSTKVVMFDSLEQMTAISAIYFESLIVMGFLKGRFFVSDVDYASQDPRYQYVGFDEGIPTTNRDSVRFQAQMNAWFEHRFPDARRIPDNLIERRIVYLHRHQTNERRRVDDATLEFIKGFLTTVAERNGYTFEMVLFEDMSARKQIEVMRTVALAIGVHGANLVNAIYMPKLSSLIEIFPFRFYHVMYERGGQSSVQYAAFGLEKGVDYPSVLNGSQTVADCIHYDPACKIFYRDGQLKFNEQDKAKFISLVEKQLRYIEFLAFRGGVVPSPN